MKQYCNYICTVVVQKSCNNSTLCSNVAFFLSFVFSDAVVSIIKVRKPEMIIYATINLMYFHVYLFGCWFDIGAMR